MIFDIKEYGAVGNGVAWDAPAIQQALDERQQTFVLR